MPWYQKLLNDFTDKNENYIEKFSKGDVGGGLLNLVGAVLNTPQSYYLNALNAATSMYKGEQPKFFYNMDYRDYSDEQKRKFGGKTLFDLTSELRSQGMAGNISGNIIETASELLTDPLFIWSVSKAVIQGSANGLKTLPNRSSGLAEGNGARSFADDAVNSADDVAEGAGEIKTTKPFNLNPTHSKTLSNKEFGALVDDIKVNGINEPIKYVKYNGEMYVVDGHHRLLAAKKLGLTDVPIEEGTLPYKSYKTFNDLFWGS